MAQKFRLRGGGLEVEAEWTTGYGCITQGGGYDEPIVYTWITKNGTKEELDACEFEQLFEPVPDQSIMNPLTIRSLEQMAKNMGEITIQLAYALSQGYSKVEQVWLRDLSAEPYFKWLADRQHDTCNRLGIDTKSHSRLSVAEMLSTVVDHINDSNAAQERCKNV